MRTRPRAPSLRRTPPGEGAQRGEGGCSVARGAAAWQGCAAGRGCAAWRGVVQRREGRTIARFLSCGRLLNSAGTATGGVGAAMRPSSLDRSASTAVCTCSRHMCERLRPWHSARMQACSVRMQAAEPHARTQAAEAATRPHRLRPGRMGCIGCSQAAWAAEAAEAAAARRGAAEAAGARRTSVVSSETLPLLMSCESFSVPLAIEAISFSPSFTSAAGTWHEPRHAGSGEGADIRWAPERRHRHRPASASEEGSLHKSPDSPEHAGGRGLLERRMAAQQG